MKKNTKNKLYQFGISIIVVILSLLIWFVTLPNKYTLAENVSNNATSTILVDNVNNFLNYATLVNTAINTDAHTLSEATSTNNVTIDIYNLPPYNGEMVISINNDIPYFEDKDFSMGDFEYYSNLDEFDRAGVAFANICEFTMPPKDTKRGSLSYKPTGWVQYLYGDNNSKHLYERCHLIAWQLGNENNNKKNLITGTAQMNSAMIEYENQVANWIRLTNKRNKNYHVLYRVTPIYSGENKLATGVEMEAKSVEEDGVAFNKFIYNVQDGFEIDYSTGKARMLE